MKSGGCHAAQDGGVESSLQEGSETVQRRASLVAEQRQSRGGPGARGSPKSSTARSGGRTRLPTSFRGASRRHRRGGSSAPSCSESACSQQECEDDSRSSAPRCSEEVARGEAVEQRGGPRSGRAVEAKDVRVAARLALGRRRPLQDHGRLANGSHTSEREREVERERERDGHLANGSHRQLSRSSDTAGRLPDVAAAHTLPCCRAAPIHTSRCEETAARTLPCCRAAPSSARSSA